jgi:hypothetical protein
VNLEGLWTGEVSVRRALILSEQLIHTPASRYRAALLGDPRFIGWTEDTSLLASVSDTLLGIAGALGGSKVTEADMWERPKQVEPEKPEVGTIAEFDPGTFMRWLMT